MQFAKLRLAGFKSFVEPTEFVVEPGLTGIVGPNGCGKSNLVEALRWVMGENRVKQMRGGEMDDVIFAGTSSRPARDVAEVSILLHNDAHKAPAQWNDLSEIEISRRIERGEGSAYRIAGKESRARDVQLFFADIASGAHSPALVSQGRIAAIINAKPAERRQILEEAAGITGLHARRHEAELKLRAAEQNLARLDDVINALDQQLQALKKQAKQAERYKNLAALIRRAEAIALTLRWRDAESARSAAGERFAQTEALVAEATTRVASATTTLTEITAQLPELRKAEAESAAKVTRLETQSQALDAEEARVRAALEDLVRRLAQLADDRAREESRRHDAASALERLAAEQIEIEEAAAVAAERLRDVEAELERQRHLVAEREDGVARATEAVAAAEAERSALQRQVAESERRLADVTARLAAAERDRAGLEAAAIPAERRAQADADVAAAEQALAAAAAGIETAEAHRRAAQEEERGARAALSVVESEVAKLDGEVQALQRLLADHGTADMFAPVIDQIRVEPGYEAALGAALGDDLTAPLDSTAPSHWRGVDMSDGDPVLPGGTIALADFVQAPAALARRLRQIGLVDDQAAPEAAARLAAGQRLVTRNGALWRWDGFTVKAGAPSAAAARLAQRNRLAELLPLRAAGQAQLEGARTRMATARQDESAAAQAEQAARQGNRRAQEALDATRQAAARLARESAEQTARLVALAERIDRLRQDHEGDTARQASLTGQIAALPDIAQAREQLQLDREALRGERDILMGLQNEATRLTREGEGRARRLVAIETETGAWTSRAQSAEQQIAALAERVAGEEAERAKLEAEPASIAERRHQLIELITAAESERKGHADTLVDAETRGREAERALKAEEATLMAEREARVRAEAQAEQTTANAAAVVALIREKLDCAPEETLAAGGVEADDNLPTLEQIEARVERLVRERDNVGPVNLRAEQEAAELDQQLDAMQGEKNDLLAAIGKLRQGIGSLNREGRERLLAAFEQVNKHFQELFTALFGGGRAHLQLSSPPADEGEEQSKDPLDAGLEVMASPPGKKLQTLSLLSGGEQALTALALLFAVFLTTPAPICVLDEVDAPLDDANVDRFCKLLDTISSRTSTRFVVVTHHRMTMARMDRLFGVTMAERGVSQLVSVDLAAAEQMRATA
ncbi:MAG: chromosome segregation protein SMC [Alphaproteobacteria bacterium]|nr:chromosome segregation protein SMC [Alphaproteobacteria bacterium]